jgi:IS1 family transposase
MQTTQCVGSNPLHRILKKPSKCKVNNKKVFGSTDQGHCRLNLSAHRCSTAYVERTNLISRQMNGSLVRKTLSFSKELRLLKAASALEDGLYNFTRPGKHVTC